MNVKRIMPLLGIMILCAFGTQGALAQDQGNENVSIMLMPESAEVMLNETTDIAVILETAPQGLAGFNLTITIEDPAIGEIVDLNFSDWAFSPENGSLPADSVWAQALDPEGLAGESNITLCTATVRGDAEGMSAITVTPETIEGVNGTLYNATVVPGELNVTGKSPTPAGLAAEFEADMTAGVVPLNVTFTDLSTGNVTTWAWDFGDGTNSTEQDPVHTYEEGGIYTVSLTVSDETNETDTMVREDYIMVSGGPAPPVGPAAEFEADTTEGEAPLNVTFTDLSTGNVTTWAWDFGDGTNSTEQNPVHTYGDDGVYTVSLTISDETNETDTMVKEDYINVSGVAPPPVGPAAEFEADTTEGEAPLNVTFTDLSTGNVTAWAWDFGDGTNSTEQSPVHTYDEGGIYTVSLTVSDEMNETDTMVKEGYINVSEVMPVGISFRPSTTSVRVGNTTDLDIVLASAEEGLAGYSLNLSVSDPAAANITAITFPDWAGFNETSLFPNSTAWMEAVDLDDAVRANATEVVLGTVTLEGVRAGTAELQVEVRVMDADGGAVLDPPTTPASITITPPPPFPGYENASTDPNGDGKYEDVNGNGIIDYDDVVVFFTDMQWIEENNLVAIFDFNNNGELDYDDVATLAMMV
ncbi:PKD repeat protein [Methanofollis sp. W23]|uniref:PKD domain-containing protein n=1 Tax=Methanofollis sp. W23 TaxID=2817849 RepID=UPI001DE3A7A3|nr:PKD domain-containing protein [Methanofollis sp. W23]MBP2144782.1 PKD repeat protein [Methanofollis sp. W23]